MICSCRVKQLAVFRPERNSTFAVQESLDTQTDNYNSDNHRGNSNNIQQQQKPHPNPHAHRLYPQSAPHILPDRGVAVHLPIYH